MSTRQLAPLTLAAILTFAIVAPTRAQGIATDRPGFIASTVSVPAGTVQFEAGVLYESTSADVTTLGEGLVRWGVTDRFEARVGVPSYQSIDVAIGESIDGFTDAGVGVKYQFGPLDAERTVDLVAVASLSIPTGDDALTSDGFDPELVLAASKLISPSVTLAAQLTGGLPTQGKLDSDREFAWGFAVGSATVLGSIGVFVELGVDQPQDGTWPAMLHTGFTFPIGRMAQLDIHGAVGLSDASPDTFVGAGFAFGG